MNELCWRQGFAAASFCYSRYELGGTAGQVNSSSEGYQYRPDVAISNDNQAYFIWQDDLVIMASSR